MANTFSPFGFRSFGHRDGSAPTMGLERVIINSSDTNLYFTGDLVVRSSQGGNIIAPTIGSTSAQLPCGVFNGCEFFSAAAARVIWSPFFPGNLGTSSSPCNAYIISDPEMQFIGMCSSGPLTSSQSVGNNITIVTSQSSLGNTATGISNMSLATAVTTASSAPWKIVDLYSNFSPPGINGVDNTTAFNIVVLAPNAWDRRAGVVGLST
jgi:hypothetical protein